MAKEIIKLNKAQINKFCVTWSLTVKNGIGSIQKAKILFEQDTGILLSREEIKDICKQKKLKFKKRGTNNESN